MTYLEQSARLDPIDKSRGLRRALVQKTLVKTEAKVQIILRENSH